MVSGKKLGEVGFKYIGTPYEKMDCQAFVERCLKDCGENMNLPGSNAWYREVKKNGLVLSPEDCIRTQGEVPKGAFLFIVRDVSDTTPAKYRNDGLGDAIHIGIVTHKGKGAIHSSKSKGEVCQSEFHDKTIKNGGWNRVGLWDRVDYDLEPIADDNLPSENDGFPADTGWHSTVRRGDKGQDVIYLQTMLYKLGYDIGPDGIDGDFGKNTERAVKEFQRDHGLVVDGVAGPMTYDALSKAEKQKTYTVTIRHLNKSQVDALQSSYPDCVATEE